MNEDEQVAAVLAIASDGGELILPLTEVEQRLIPTNTTLTGSL